MKKRSRQPVQAAGGIVVRPGRAPQFAIVQMRDYGVWALPKGKLAYGETHIAAARREVLEETGYEVTIHEFLGTLAYEVGGRPKIVQFWRMQPTGDEPVGKLMRDVSSIKWMSLAEALATLTHPREREFLRVVGPQAIAASKPARARITRGPDPPEAMPSAVFHDGIAAPAHAHSAEDETIAAAPIAVRSGLTLIDRARAWLRRQTSRPEN